MYDLTKRHCKIRGNFMSGFAQNSIPIVSEEGSYSSKPLTEGGVRSKDAFCISFAAEGNRK